MNYRNLNYEDPNDIKKAILNISCCAGGGLEIGGEVTGGNPNAVLFLDGSSLLDTDPDFTYVSGTSFNLDNIAAGFYVKEWSISNTYTEFGVDSTDAFLISNGAIHRWTYNDSIIFSQGNSSVGGIFQNSNTIPNTFGFGLTTSSDVFAKVHFKNTRVGDKVLIVEGITGQTANLQEWQVNGTTLTSIASNGQLTLPNNVFAQWGSSAGARWNSGGYFEIIERFGSGIPDLRLMNTGELQITSSQTWLNGFYTGVNVKSVNPTLNITDTASNRGLGLWASGTQAYWAFTTNNWTTATYFGQIDFTNKRWAFGNNFNPTATIHATSWAVSDVVIKANGVVGQTANLQEWQVNGSTVARVSPAGRFYIDSADMTILRTGFINNANNSQTVITTNTSNANVLFGGEVKVTDTKLLANATTMTDHSGASAGTLSNAPSAGDPTKWIAIDDNGTTRYIPTWT